MDFSIEKAFISSYLPVYEKELLHISDLQFGQGYLSKADLDSYIINSNSHLLIVTYKNNLIGFSVFEICDFETTCNQLRLEKIWFEKNIGQFKTVCIRKHIAVHPDFEQMGIGNLLLEKGLQYIKNKAEVVISMAWQNELTIPIEDLLIRHGFSKTIEFQDYWYQDSISKNYFCESCGHPPCSCSAVLYSLIM